MVRSLSALLTRHAALTASVALHAGAVIAGGHAFSEGIEGRAATAAPMEVEIELAGPPASVVAAPTPTEQAPLANVVRRASAGHRHSYRVSPDHDAHPHNPSVVHMAGPEPAPPPIVAETSAEQPLHFVLPPGPEFSTRGMPTGAAQKSVAGESGEHASGGSEGGTTFAESAVDAKARLASSVPVVYPETARAAELEADVRLELVVDPEGRVVSARPLAPRGLGLDEAALRAVRAYRFSPARRAGRPVRVRMEWTVAFRLQ
jgi:periplasmic protein TonB